MKYLESIQLYRDLGLEPLINAEDFQTVLGGSRTPAKVLAAMAEAQASFVEMEKLQKRVGEEIARLTHNEAALVTSCATASIAIGVAACITRGDEAAVGDLANGRRSSLPTEVVVHRSQLVEYGHAAVHGGAQLVEIGNIRTTYEWELEASIGPQTAAVLYFSGTKLARGALPLETVVEIAHSRGVPVVLDAASQLPPVSNLWHYTKMGVDLVAFSGGKALRGPQDSGLLLGDPALIESARQHMNRRYAVGRGMKVGRGQMIGLLTAIQLYIEQDHDAERIRQHDYVERLIADLGDVVSTRRLDHGPHGQDFPRAAVHCGDRYSAAQLRQRLLRGCPPIAVAASEDDTEIYLNFANVESHEYVPLVDRLREELA